MIAFIEGELLELQPNYALVLTASGLGYGVEISANTSAELRAGERVRLHTLLVVKEDSQRLFGFVSKIEQRYFAELLRVNGVGCVSALAILSAFTPAQLQTAVQQNDVAAIKKAPGIGPKTAQRLILELKDRLAKNPALYASSAQTAANAAQTATSAQDEALAALIALGFKHDAAAKALAKSSGQSASELVKAALKNLA